MLLGGGSEPEPSGDWNLDSMTVTVGGPMATPNYMIRGITGSTPVCVKVGVENEYYQGSGALFVTVSDNNPNVNTSGADLVTEGNVTVTLYAEGDAVIASGTVYAE